jgi:hypothetical protein
MCPDCHAEAEAARQKSRAATGRKAKAFGTLVADMAAAIAPIFKPIWEMTLAKPITALFVILIGWSMLSGPSEDPTPTRSASSLNRTRHTATYRTRGALPAAPPIIWGEDRLPPGSATDTICPTAIDCDVETSTVRAGLMRTDTEPTPTATTGPVAISGTWRRGRMSEGVMGMVAPIPQGRVAQG